MPSPRTVTVNGVVYTNVHKDANDYITLSSTKHDGVFRTTFMELRTYYGRQTARAVAMELNRRGYSVAEEQCL